MLARGVAPTLQSLLRGLDCCTCAGMAEDTASTCIGVMTMKLLAILQDANATVSLIMVTNGLREAVMDVLQKHEGNLPQEAISWQMRLGFEVDSGAASEIEAAEGNPEWVQETTDDGQVYYENTQTGETKWEPPDEIQVVAPVASEWVAMTTAEGQVYYDNIVTGETKWDTRDETQVVSPVASEWVAMTTAEGQVYY